MKARKNASGLFEFDINVRGEKKSKVLKGLIDTGSTDCACTYKVITTLQVRPIDSSMVSTINSSRDQVLSYLAYIEFSGKKEMVKIFRFPELPDDIHLILGMSFLSKCNLDFKDDYVEINWK